MHPAHLDKYGARQGGPEVWDPARVGGCHQCSPVLAERAVTELLALRSDKQPDHPVALLQDQHRMPQADVG